MQRTIKQRPAATTTARHRPSGVASVIRRARTLGTLAELSWRVTVLKPSGADLGKWLSARLPTLGPTYVKIGQFISSRRDIFGDDFSTAFTHLRDDVPPIPDSDIDAVLRNSINLDQFASVERVPMASASIGQVHRATLLDGRQVVVKIKRPGIDRLIRDDINFISSLMGALRFMRGGGTQYDQAQDSVTEMEAYLLQEVDFVKEANNVRRFAAIYSDSNDVVIPRLHGTLSGDAAVVMDYVYSTSLSEFVTAANACNEEGGGRRAKKGKKRKKSTTAAAAANKLMDVFVSQLVYKGIVHGDPHPGNFGFDRSGRIVIYDFGNIIEVSDVERQRMKEMIYQLLLGNNNGVMDTLRKLGVEVIDEAALYGYIDMYRDYMRTIDISKIRDSQTAASEMPLRLTSKFMRLMRVYSMLEGTCKSIFIDFNYFDMLDDYIDALFFDEEFVTYKIGEDVRTLVGGLSGSRSSQPVTAKPSMPTSQAAATTIKGASNNKTDIASFAVIVLIILDHLMP